MEKILFISFFETGDNKHCPNQLIKQKVSGFLGGLFISFDTIDPSV
jgi:hypothetical protein